MNKFNGFEPVTENIEFNKTEDELKKEFKEVVKDINIDEDANTVMKFFKTLYPQLQDINSYKKKADIVKVGFLHISRKNYTRGKRGISNLSNATEKFIRKELKGIYKQPYNSYYSLCLHSAFKEDEKDGEFKPTIRASKDNTKFVGILGLDVDAKTKTEFKKQLEKADKIEEELNIKSLKINTSNLGQQRIYLLNKLYEDKTLQSQFVQAVSLTSLEVDEKTKDCSRLFRLPCSLHTKAFSKKSRSKYNGIYFVDWINKNEKLDRYDPYKLIEKIKALSVSEEQEVETTKDIEKTDKPVEKPVIKKEKTTNEVKTLKELADEVGENRLSDEELQDIYNCINIQEVPEPIKLMLSYAPVGLRNPVLRALHYYFKSDYPLPLTSNNIRYILLQQKKFWESEEREFMYQIDYIIKNNQSLKVCNDNELKVIYGSYKHIIIAEQSEYVMINNMLIDSFKYLKGNSFEFFLKMLMNEAENGIKENYTKEELVEITGVSESSFKRYTKDLITAKLIIKNKAKDKKKGSKTTYYINPRYRDYKNGYEKLKPFDIQGHMALLDLNELQLYYYFRLKTQNGEFRKNQEDIAKDLGVSRRTIINLTEQLSQKRAIKKITEGGSFFKITTYRIN